VLVNLSSSKITIHLSFLVLISLQNHCFVLIIAFGIEYSLNESLNNLLLALNIGSVGTRKGNLYIIKYFKASQGKSTHSQKLSVHKITFDDGEDLKSEIILCLLQEIDCDKSVVQIFFNSMFAYKYKSFIDEKEVNKIRVFHLTIFKKSKIKLFIIGFKYFIDPKSFGTNKSDCFE
jgi:hypothetical protein